MGGGNEPVHRWEFDLWREGWERRIRELERLHDGHEEGHEQHGRPERGVPARAGERRRWSVPEIVVAAITAAGVVAAAAITALGK